MLDDTGLAGLILACDPQSFSLTARLPDGSEGAIPFREIKADQSVPGVRRASGGAYALHASLVGVQRLFDPGV